MSSARWTGYVSTRRGASATRFDPTMGGAIGGIMGGSAAILPGRRTYEQFAPAWSARTGAPSGVLHLPYQPA
jgi:hypothetical protein